MYQSIKTCFFLVLGLLVSAEAFAQPGGSRGQGRSGQNRQSMMQRLPVMAALDKDKDGKISKDEIANASKALLTLDKDENGELDSAEMRPEGGFGGGFGGGRGQRGGRGGGGRGGKGGGGKGGNSGVSAKVFDFLAEKYDKNGDKKISLEEHNRGEELFSRLDKDGDQFLTAKDWLVDAPREKKKSLAAPVAGVVAPDFELTLVDDANKTMKLSSFAGEKPVALIFGSCS